jgi:hypothetical protein
MIVYRVEYTDGEGPYRARKGNAELVTASGQICGDHGWGDKEHPPPELEGLDLSSDWYCGFESEEKLIDWFRDHNWLRRLADLGYRFVAYWVDDDSVQCGQRQLIFLMGEAEKIMDEPLDTVAPVR